MADLIAIAYPKRETASDVMRTLARLQTEHVIELDDLVAVNKDQDGKIRLDQSVDLVGRGALGGALWGSLIGMIFLMPLLGMLLGAAGGALGGKLSDYGIDDRFMKELGAQLQPGGSAVFMLVSKMTPDKALDEVSRYGGTVLRTSLSRDAEANLQSALQAHTAGAR